MFFYLTLLVFVTLFSALVSYVKDRNKARLFKIVTLLLISLPAAIRYGVGVDYWNYVFMFQEIKQFGLGITEIGYNLLNLWVANSGGNAQTVIAIMAFGTVYFFFKGVPNKYWKVYAPLFLLLTYHWYFTTIRQMFAASLAFYAWREIHKGETLKSILAVAIAFTFHYSAFMYPVFYLISKYVHFSKWGVVVCFLGAFTMVYAYSDMISEKIVLLIGSSSIGYDGYANSEWILKTDEGSGWGLITNYVTFALTLLCYPKDDNEESKALYMLLLIYILFMVLSTQVTILNRISRGLIFVWFPVMWNIVSAKYRYKEVWVLAIYFLLLAFFVARTIGDPNLTPYQVYFNH